MIRFLKEIIIEMALYIKKSDSATFKQLLQKETEVLVEYEKIKQLEIDSNKEYSRVTNLWVDIKRKHDHCVSYEQPIDETLQTSFESLAKEKLKAQKQWISAEQQRTSLFWDYWDVIKQLNELVGCNDYLSAKIKSRIV